MPSKRRDLNSVSSPAPSAFPCQKKTSPSSPWLTATLLFAFLLASRDPLLFSLKVVFNLQHPQWPPLYGLCFLTSPCSQIFCSTCFPKLQRSPETLVTTLGVVVIGLIAMFLCSIFHHCHLLLPKFPPFLHLPYLPTMTIYFLICSLLLSFLCFSRIPYS